MIGDHPAAADGTPDAVWRRAAAYVVCRDAEDRLLLTRFYSTNSPTSGHWTMPGGGMDWGENPVDTARRELEEETGLVGDIGQLLGVWSRWLEAHETASGDPGHMIGVIYEANNLRGELRTDFSGTTDAAAWFTLEEAQALPHVSLVDFVLNMISPEPSE